MTHIYSKQLDLTGFGDYLEVFQPDHDIRSTAALNEPCQRSLIPESTAQRFFGTTDVLGKSIYVGPQIRQQPLVIGGVYRIPGEFPD